MKKRRSNRTHKCTICDKYIQRPYTGTICYDCFADGKQPDIELAFNYHIQGHSLDCSLDMSDGGVCGCEK